VDASGGCHLVTGGVGKAVHEVLGQDADPGIGVLRVPDQQVEGGVQLDADVGSGFSDREVEVMKGLLDNARSGGDMGVGKFEVS
jgi:hypothetical protein